MQLAWTSSPARTDLTVLFFAETLPPLQTTLVTIPGSQPVGSAGTLTWSLVQVPEGRYSVSASFTDGAGASFFLAHLAVLLVDHGTYGFPTIELTSPAATVTLSETNPFFINWRATDLDSQATVSFFVDADAIGFNGQRVLAGVPFDGTRNLMSAYLAPPLPVGRHHVYGVIDDGQHPSHAAYAPGTLEVYGFERSSFPVAGTFAPCVEVSPDGVPHALYVSDGGIWHNRLNADGGWLSTRVTTVNTSSNSYFDCTFHQGRLAALVKPPSGSLLYLQDTPAGWAVTTTVSGPFPGRESVTFDSSDRPTLCWVDTFVGAKVSRLTGTTWSTEVVAASPNIDGCTLTKDAMGRLVAVYDVNPTATSTTGELYLATNIGASWQSERIVAATTNRGWSVRVNAAGQPALAFVSEPDGGNASPLGYAERRDAGWSVELVRNPLAYVDFGGQPALEFGPTGEPSIASQYRRRSGLDEGVVVARRTDAGFSLFDTGADSDRLPSAGRVGLGFDPAGFPVVIWYHRDFGQELIEAFRWKR